MKMKLINEGQKLTYDLSDLTDTLAFDVRGQYLNYAFKSDGSRDDSKITGISLLLDDRSGGLKQTFFVTIPNYSELPFENDEIGMVKVTLIDAKYQYKCNKKGYLDIDIIASDYEIIE